MLKSNPNPVEQPRPDLKPTFLRYLPERIDAIVEGWLSLMGKGWNLAKLAQLIQRIQDLSAVADKFDSITIRDGLKSLNQCLQLLLDNRQPPTPQQIEQIQKISNQLQQLHSDNDNEVTDSVFAATIVEQQIQIFYFGDNEGLTPGLNVAMSALRYQLLRFTKYNELIAKIHTHRPAALIIEATHLTQIATALTKTLQQYNQSPPILIALSQSNSFELRLQALRSGAAAFFSAPIDPQAVAARLRRLLTPIPELPFRILIVDDDSSQAEFAAAILRKGGLEVRTAIDPSKLFEILETFKPDLILMDLYMPNVDGLELTKIIRDQQVWASVPIVFMSGEQDADKQLDALSVGGDDFVTKPVRPRRLITIIKSRILRTRASQNLMLEQENRDSVTGLLNRRSLLEKINGILTAGRSDAVSGLICLEIDGLDSIREAVGLRSSDALLVAISSRFLSHLTPEDLCAHIDDNRFAVVATRSKKQDLLQLGEALVQSITQRPIAVDGLKTPPSLSAGLCWLNPVLETATTLEQRAIVACNLARKDGNNRLVVRTGAEKVETTDKPLATIDTVELIKQTLHNNKLQITFQPFIGIRDRQLEIHEMQWRIPTADGNLLLPAEALNAAKPHPGLSLDIDRWLILRALDILREHRQSGRQIWLFIPQTVETMTDPKTAPWLREELRRRLLVGTGLIFKFNLVDLVTDIKSARNLLADLSIMGVEMCLGRFGRNEASYKVLRYLKMPYVKIADKLLTADAQTIATLLQQVREVNSKLILAKAQDPRTIAQEWLAGADFIQGNITSRS